MCYKKRERERNEEKVDKQMKGKDMGKIVLTGRC